MVAVIPAYEPNQMLIQLVQQLKKLKFSVLLIDDGSSIEKQSILIDYKKWQSCFIIQKLRKRTCIENSVFLYTGTDARRRWHCDR